MTDEKPQPHYEKCHAHEAEVRRIQKMEETLAALGVSTDSARQSLAETWDAVNDMRPMIAKTEKTVEEVKVALLGDLREYKGLVTRVHELEARHSTMWIRIDELGSVLGGDKNSGNAGLVERVRGLERTADRAARVGWIILAAIIGQTVTIGAAIAGYFIVGG